jgi:hypothetical protein
MFARALGEERHGFDQLDLCVLAKHLCESKTTEGVKT